MMNQTLQQITPQVCAAVWFFFSSFFFPSAHPLYKQWAIFLSLSFLIEMLGRDLTGGICASQHFFPAIISPAALVYPPPPASLPLKLQVLRFTALLQWGSATSFSVAAMESAEKTFFFGLFVYLNNYNDAEIMIIQILFIERFSKSWKTRCVKERG